MNANYLETGKIVSTHGIRGEVKVLPWADAPEFLLKFKTFYIAGGGVLDAPKVSISDPGGPSGTPAPTALTVESSRVQKTTVLIKFRGIDSVEQAAALRDQVLSIARDDPHIPAGTVFHADLMGLPVRADGVEIGTIREILSMPAADVLVVKGTHEYMIPNVKAFVPSLDLSKGFLEVNLIEGMRSDEK